MQFGPVGISGLLLAGLLAALMSTFAPTVDAASAHSVNDIHQRYINPDAGNRCLVRASCPISVLLVVVSTLVLSVESVNSVPQ